MKDFWTCGPFKECVDRLDLMAFKIGQTNALLALLEEDKANQELANNGSADEQVLAALIQIDIDNKMSILLGVSDGTEEKTNEISREAVLEFISQKSAK